MEWRGGALICSIKPPHRRYLHYYKRYDNHHKAQQYAEKQEEEIERRMMRLQETDGSRWIDVQFLKAANEKLVECRRVLKYTYVFGYYLPEGTARKRLFEHHQVRPSVRLTVGDCVCVRACV